MSASVLRTSLRSLPLLRRHVATTAVRASEAESSTQAHPQSRPAESAADAAKYPSHTTLPPEKMRALISLYHQADKFITPETLDKAIDDAFIGDLKYTEAQEVPYEELWRLAALRRRMPKVGIAAKRRENVVGSSREERSDRVWSEQRTKRDAAVEAALYGTEGPWHKPGVETLEDEYERIREHLENDRKNQA